MYEPHRQQMTAAAAYLGQVQRRNTVRDRADCAVLLPDIGGIHLDGADDRPSEFSADLETAVDVTANRQFDLLHAPEIDIFKAYRRAIMNVGDI